MDTEGGPTHCYVDRTTHRWVPALSERYGSTFTTDLPFFGKTVVIGDPIQVKDVFSTGDDLLERPTNILDPVFGPGLTFSLAPEEHLKRRLLLPAFNGKGVRDYEHIVEEEVMSETADWPEGREFETLPTMGRLTLNAILRAVFGEESDALDELRSAVPDLVTVAPSFIYCRR